MTTPSRILQTTLLAVALVGPITSAGAEDPAARALVQQMLDAAPTVPFFARAKLSSAGGWVRELSMSHKHTADGDATFLEVTAPEDVKDTRFLFIERKQGRDQQFIYLPTVRRAIEVMDDSRKQPFLGSDFYVSDLVAPDLDAFTYAVTGEEEVGGRRCKLVEVVPKTPENEIYGKAVIAIDPVDHLLMRSEFFDQKGKPFKVWTLSKVEKIDGVWTPLRQEMKNVQKNSTSVLEIEEIKYNVQLSDQTFSRQNLIR